MYVVDFALMIFRLLPPDAVGTKMQAWLQALVAPLVALYSSPSTAHPVREPICPGLETATSAGPSFVAFRDHINLRLSFTGQTIQLERLLNLYYYTVFDTSVARANPGYQIFIEDEISDIPYIPLFLVYENQPLPTYSVSEYAPGPPAPPNGTTAAPGPQYIFTMAEYNAVVDFIVWVPVLLVFDEAEMKALIDSYRKAGTRYIIKTY